MPVLKDMYCRSCGNTIEAIVESDQVTTKRPCGICQKETAHDSRCSGGIKLKPYITEASYAGRDWDAESMPLAPPTATYANGKPVYESDGGRTDKKHFGDWEARIKAKKDRKRSDRKRAEGSQSLFFDQKG